MLHKYPYVFNFYFLAKNCISNAVSFLTEIKYINTSLLSVQCIILYQFLPSLHSCLHITIVHSGPGAWTLAAAGSNLDLM